MTALKTDFPNQYKKPIIDNLIDCKADVEKCIADMHRNESDTDIGQLEQTREVLSYLIEAITHDNVDLLSSRLGMDGTTEEN